MPGISICPAFGASPQGVSGPSQRAEAEPGQPGGHPGASLPRHRPAAAAARGHRGRTKGSVGRGARARDRPGRRVANPRWEGRPTRGCRVASRHKKRGGPRAGCAGPRAAGMRSTCLAPRWRSRTSHLSSSCLKSTRKKLCARGGPRGGQGPGCEAEGDRPGGGWEGGGRSSSFLSDRTPFQRANGEGRVGRSSAYAQENFQGFEVTPLPSL